MKKKLLIFLTGICVVSNVYAGRFVNLINAGRYTNQQIYYSQNQSGFWTTVNNFGNLTRLGLAVTTELVVDPVGFVTESVVQTSDYALTGTTGSSGPIKNLATKIKAAHPSSMRSKKNTKRIAAEFKTRQRLRKVEKFTNGLNRLSNAFNKISYFSEKLSNFGR